jgi:hypothetical protein
MKTDPSLVVLLHPAAIHLVGIAEKMPEKKNFSQRTNSRLRITCAFARVFIYASRGVYV